MVCFLPFLILSILIVNGGFCSCPCCCGHSKREKGTQVFVESTKGQKEEFEKKMKKGIDIDFKKVNEIFNKAEEFGEILRNEKFDFKNIIKDGNLTEEFEKKIRGAIIKGFVPNVVMEFLTKASDNGLDMEKSKKTKKLCEDIFKALNLSLKSVVKKAQKYNKEEEKRQKESRS